MYPWLSIDEQGFPVADGQVLDLPPKERAVLVLLLGRQPAVVSKNEFAEQAWGGRLMSDESLARCISRLRRLLSARGLAIESVYGTGYRLAGPAAALAPPPTLQADARLIAAAQAHPATLDAYLHARRLAGQRTPAALARAITLLRELTGREPSYAPARVALAEALAGAASWGLAPTRPAIDEGLAQLEAAAALAPMTPGMAGARAFLLDLAWRFDEAAERHHEALRSHPADADSLLLHGRHLLLVGRHHEAVDQLRRALALLPHSALLRVTLARALAHAGEMAEALHEAEATCDEHPDDAVAAAYRLGLLAHTAPSPELLPAIWRIAELRDAPPFALAIFTYVLARLDRHDEALWTIDTCLGCHGSGDGAALLHVAALSALGEHERALALLEEGLAQACGVLPMVLRDPANVALMALPAAQATARAVFGPHWPSN